MQRQLHSKGSGICYIQLEDLLGKEYGQAIHDLHLTVDYFA